ncbi:voltage-gated potassium channel [Pustulibacterium marinum]|uniref:Voltage-gated potassium channel n=1 Tax=Pustulibacterium marinum TaxID=1224947 RepID=A0A1I7HQN4_9FLAO|nr:potassium channel protein [Pustulibacterium marinum]SFU62980.1 voltage-gated potassium channel [Pustulibacterium marinum]
MFKLFRPRLFIAIILLLAVFASGIVGYKIIAGYSWVEAAYMTVITISTVGFSEIRPTDEPTKIFTIILILSGLFILGFAVSVVTEYLLARSTFHNVKYRRMKKKIDTLKGHIIICGYGRNGKQAAEKLKAYKKPFVIIEKDEEVANSFDEETLYILGNANEDETLSKAGIEQADCLITALPEDADNLFIVLSARQLNKNLKIISRASDETSLKKLKLAGADKTVMPDKIGGDHMASMVVLPDLVDFMDTLAFEGQSKINLEEISIDDISKGQQIKSILDLDIRKRTGCNVIGYKKPNGEYIINPESTLLLEPNSKIIVLGRPEQIHKLNELFRLV